MIKPISQQDTIPLKPYQPRSFLPPGADLRDPRTVEGLYIVLRDETVGSSSDLAAWLIRRSELEAALDQQETVLYIRMTCQTDDEEKAAAYQAFVRDVEPVIHRMEDELNRKFVAWLEQFPLEEDHYSVLIKEVRADLALFREENVTFFTELSLLSQQYQKMCGAMTVVFDGEERTLPQMAKYALDPDRAVREAAWQASTARRLQDKEALENLFDAMLTLRRQVARNAGCAGYEEYQFRAKHRFDYTPEDCRRYHDSIERCVVPLWTKILRRRREQMKLDTLRPWDLSVDPLGRPPLKPFAAVEDLISGVNTMFAKTDSRLGEQFAQMADLGLLDLASRKGKAPGGYQSTLSEYRKPFIFMNAVGLDADVRTLLHEGGHAFHAFACASEPLYDYRHGPMEFNEVASMSMELLADDHMTVFYNEDDARRSRRNHLEDIVFVLCWVAAVDAFQQWIYAHPGHTPEERRHAWVSLHKRFGGNEVDWEGLEEARGYAWHRQLHIFEAPFYYIEYGIAQLGALQLWLHARRDKRAAIDAYLKALSLGGSRPLPELFAAAGLQFDFSERTIKPLAQLLDQELEKGEGA